MITWRNGPGTHRVIEGEVIYGDSTNCLVTLTPVATGYLASVTERERTWCSRHSATAECRTLDAAKAWAEEAVRRFERMLA